MKSIEQGRGRWLGAWVCAVLAGGCGGGESPPSAPPPPPPAASAAEAPAGSGPALPPPRPVDSGPLGYLEAVVAAQDRAAVTVALASAQRAVDAFQALEGRFPTGLDELVSAGVVPSLPTLPAAYAFAYDASTGRVRVIRRS